MGLREIASALLSDPPRVDERRGVLPPGWSTWITGRSVGGGVTYDVAQSHSAVYACTDLLCRLIAWQMPVEVDGRQIGPLVAPGVLSAALDPHPEPHMGRQHWDAQVLESGILRGYACGVVTEKSSNGDPLKILPTHPDKLQWDRVDGRWAWKLEHEPIELWQLGGDLWVAPALKVPAGRPVGYGVLHYAAEQIRLGLAASKFGRDFFAAGGMPVAWVRMTDQPGLTNEQAEVISDRFDAKTRNRRPLVTGSNVDIKPIQVNADESQFLATISANKADVCSFFGVPPESIGGSSGDSMTYATVEGRNLWLLTNTVGAWMQWMEWVKSSLLPGSMSVKLDPEALLRTSVPTAFQTAAAGYQAGILTRDEARAMLEYGGSVDGDQFKTTTPALPAMGGGQNA